MASRFGSCRKLIADVKSVARPAPRFPSPQGRDQGWGIRAQREGACSMFRRGGRCRGLPHPGPPLRGYAIHTSGRLSPTQAAEMTGAELEASIPPLNLSQASARGRSSSPSPRLRRGGSGWGVVQNRARRRSKCATGRWSIKFSSHPISMNAPHPALPAASGGREKRCIGPRGCDREPPFSAQTIDPERCVNRVA
jgi:hypothetical protein